MGVVTANTNEGGDSKHQVKVRFPWLPSGDSEESHWARMLTPMAGAQRGVYCVPEIDDQVLVVFEHGDIARPIVIGSLWSQAEPPPEVNADGKNNIRVIKSKSGHRIILDDTEGAERVIIVDSTKKNKILLDSANKVTTIETADGDIELKASKGIHLHGKEVTVTAKSNFSGKGTQSLEVGSGGALHVKAGGNLNLKGSSTQVNAGGGPPTRVSSS